jgi:ABC-2 type transport system ATP-binding protein
MNAVKIDPAEHPELAFEHVSRWYGTVQALRDVSFTAHAGEVTAILGPNGAGKTTLVSTTTGLRRPDTGRVTVCGHDVAADPGRVRPLVGVAPQELGIYPTLSVRENLMVFCELAGLSGRCAKARITDLADRLDLGQVILKPAGQLSGGQQRRVHTAIALVGSSKVLILDEPTTGVDVMSRQRLLELVRETAASGCAVCYSTHYLPEVETLAAEKVVILDHGEVIAQGSIPELTATAGGGAIVLSFAGSAPDVALDSRFVRRAETLTVNAKDPVSELEATLTALGSDKARLIGIDIRRPSLETAFLGLIQGGSGGPSDDVVKARSARV